MTAPPPLEVTEWLNSDKSLTLEDFRGRVLLVEVFQLLCPGCVQHSLPQARKVTDFFDPKDVAVIGLHSVFEHHEAQGRRDVLAAFLHENRLKFPVGMDAPGKDGVPLTFRAYNMRGTPTALLFDRAGKLAMQHFGQADDLALGSAITRVMLTANVSQQAPGD